MAREWLIRRRRENGFTQEKLASMVGVSKKHISAIERGYRNPSGHVAMRISKVLGFDMAYFFEENRDQKDSA